VELDRRLREDARFEPLAAGLPELDIVVWKMKAKSAEEASRRAQEIFDGAAKRDLHLALVQLPHSWFGASGGAQDAGVTCLRSVLMKPEHEAWLDRIWERLSAAAG
jgi:hypothetical protein